MAFNFFCMFSICRKLFSTTEEQAAKGFGALVNSTKKHGLLSAIGCFNEPEWRMIERDRTDPSIVQSVRRQVGAKIFYLAKCYAY